MNEEDQVAWDLFFAEITGWTFHPGYYRENATKPTLKECADTADEMLKLSKERAAMRMQRA